MGGGGRLLAVGNAVGAGVGVWEYVWGTVRAGVLGGGGGGFPGADLKDRGTCRPLGRPPLRGAPAGETSVVPSPPTASPSPSMPLLSLEEGGGEHVNQTDM